MKIVTYITCVTICLMVAATAGFATSFGVHDWYLQLHKPSFNPPSWVFAPVWTILYILMGIAWAQALTTVSHVPKLSINFAFALQLLFNFAWSFLFFNWHKIGLALLDINLLFVSILLTIRVFASVSRLAGGLLLPYLAWVGFAGFLNLTLWQMN